MSYNLPDFEGRDVIFVGKGKEGLSFQKFIESWGGIHSFTFVDKKDDPDYLKRLQSTDLSKSIVVKTPGIPGRLMTVPYTTPTRVFIDCAKQIRSNIVGVTGTKGKTTTSNLIAAILQNSGYDARLCGNGGSPMLDSLEAADQNTIFVVEMSSYQLAEVTQSPNIAVITNIFHDHVDYHGTHEAYVAAKSNIVKYMQEGDKVIYLPTNQDVVRWLEKSKARGIPIDPKEPVDMSRSKIFGEHNKINYLLARTAAEQYNVDKLTAMESLESFEPIRHRLEMVRKVRGVTFVDDAIGSTPEATIAGIQALIQNKGPVGCVMLGGVDRNYDFSHLVKLLHLVGIPKLVLFPDTGEKIKNLLPEAYKPDIFETRDMESAVNWAAENTPSGSICLLSTASPSTVLWSNFEEKGSVFQQAVQGLNE